MKKIANVLKFLNLQFALKTYHKLKLILTNNSIRKEVNQYVSSLNGTIHDRNKIISIHIPDSQNTNTPSVFFLRKFSSDLPVFKQLIIQGEYSKIINILNKSNIEALTIIDAGANIGIATQQFKKAFPNAKVICIEPDDDNVSMIQKTIEGNNFSDVFIEKAGLLDSNTFLKISNNYRDNAKWSLQVDPTDAVSDLYAITIPSIIKKYSLGTIDLLKIDIEGAEAQIFRNTEHIKEFLSYVKVLCLEVHEEYITVSEVHDILRKHNFHCVRNKDLTIGINPALVSEPTIVGEKPL